MPIPAGVARLTSGIQQLLDHVKMEIRYIQLDMAEHAREAANIKERSATFDLIEKAHEKLEKRHGKVTFLYEASDTETNPYYLKIDHGEISKIPIETIDVDVPNANGKKEIKHVEVELERPLGESYIIDEGHKRNSTIIQGSVSRKDQGF